MLICFYCIEWFLSVPALPITNIKVSAKSRLKPRIEKSCGALWYTFTLADFAVRLLSGKKYRLYCSSFNQVYKFNVMVSAFIAAFSSQRLANPVSKLNIPAFIYCFALRFLLAGA